MTDTTPEAETPGRLFARYVDEGTGEVDLPGYLDARPSHVSAGDVFSFAGEFRDDVFVEGGRFEEVDAPSESSPNARHTKAVLGEILGVNPDDYSKDDLVSLADDRDRMFPPVPGAQQDPREEAVPIPGQDVDSDPDPDPSGDDAGDDDDTPEA